MNVAPRHLRRGRRRPPAGHDQVAHPPVDDPKVQVTERAATAQLHTPRARPTSNAVKPTSAAGGKVRVSLGGGASS